MNERGTSHVDVPADCNAATLVALIWETLVDVLGSAATATLIQRSVKIASRHNRAVEGVVVTREGFEYAYALPELWKESGNPATIDALRSLATELGPLLAELTGPVVIRRLSQAADLRRCQILFEQERRA